MIPIILSNNRISLIDDIDADLLENEWHMTDKRYVGRFIYVDDKRIAIKLHRVVLERKLGRPINEEMVTDHINGNSCDNRRGNLREVTQWENVLNGLTISDRIRSRSGFRGVVLDHSPRAKVKKWMAILHYKSKRIYIGRYETPEQAAVAYNEAAIKHCGQAAKLNSVPLSPLTIDLIQEMSKK